MKWYKHDSDANMDNKLQEVLLDYGLEGYGLYWYCLELIVNKVDVDNLTFVLEHDARIIARNTGSTPQKVSEMMKRFVELGLFENSEGRITCMKLLTRLDKSMTSNPKFRNAIEQAKQSHDSVMTNPDLVMQDKIRLEEIREEKRTEITQQAAPPVFDEIQHLFNNVIISTNANWSKLTIVNNSRKTRIKKLIKFAEQRIKRDPEDKRTPSEYLGELLLAMAMDDFYSGNKHSAAYPTGYRWSFDDITRETHIIKFIERETA